MDMLYDSLVVDMVVYDMQVWCGCVLFGRPFGVHDFRDHVCKSMYAMVYMDMDLHYNNNIGMWNISNDRVQTNKLFKSIKQLKGTLYSCLGSK